MATTIVTNPTFSPTQISTCCLWLDAADASTVTTNNGNITNIKDKSPSNVTLSNATGFRYPNNSFNGSYPSFYNSNGGHSFTTAAHLGSNASFALATPFHVFFVAYQISIVGDYGYIIDSANGSGRPYILQPNLQTPMGVGGTTPLCNAPCVVSIPFTNATNALYVNGSNFYNGTTVSLTTGGITVANRFSDNEAWPGHICELIIYNSFLGTSQRQQVEGYLAWKWNLVAQLPSSHPYKNSRPTV